MILATAKVVSGGGHFASVGHEEGAVVGAGRRLWHTRTSPFGHCQVS
jgi:hypothetical protein